MRTPHSSPIGRQLRVYEEGWKGDHDEALRFWDFQENLSVGIAIFHAIAHRNISWRQRVSQGVESFRPEDNDEVLGLFQCWLQSCDLATARLEYFEQEFGSVEGASQFRKCCHKATQTVASWVPPALSQATGLHVTQFSAGEAEQLGKALESGAAQLRLKPRRIK